MTDDQHEKEARCAALEAATKVLKEANLFEDLCMKDSIDWKQFVSAMDRAYDAANKASGDVYIDTKHICASAVFYLIHDELNEEPHPYCNGAIPFLAIGQWMVCRELALQLSMADEDGQEILGTAISRQASN